MAPPQGKPELLDKPPWFDSRIGDASYTELEIEHILQLLLDPKLEGQEFFYILDSAHSDPKADAGEPGGRSEA